LENSKNPPARCFQEQATRPWSEPICDHPAANKWLQGLTMHILFPFNSVFCNFVLTRSPFGAVWYSFTSSSTISEPVQPFEAFESRVEGKVCRQYSFCRCKQVLEGDKLTNEIVKPQQRACKLAFVLEYDVDPRPDTAVNQLYPTKSECVPL